MSTLLSRSPQTSRATFAACLLALTLTGCTLGPEFVRPTSAAPDDWAQWRSADASLRQPVGSDALPAQWWQAFGDPVLDRLQARALDASPDLRTAALHFAQARIQRGTVAAQQGPEIDFSGAVTRQRQSEFGTGTRMLDAIGNNRAALAKVLGEPFTLYQAGFDASWEPDLWGRVQRSIEAADADVSKQAALLDLARLSLRSDVARNYIELRTTQRLIHLTRDDIAALEDRLKLLEARVQGGVLDHLDLERQRAQLASIKAQLPGLLAQEGASINQLSLLLGQRPGTLRDELVSPGDESLKALPDLALGLPSEIALRRPDIRAAEARLQRATARIGIAEADLYPSIRLGARAGYESFLSEEFSAWSSRTWSIGPTLNLPLFDRGRRKSVVQLRELEQQEAAVNFQQTVLKAWQEIDDALSAYAADQQQLQQTEAQVRAAGQAYQLAQARYAGGTTDFLSVLDAQRSWLQARRDRITTQGHLRTRFVAVNKLVGNVGN